jgi:hypothetical protein
MRALVFLSFAALAACASPGGGTGTPSPVVETVRVTGGAGPGTIAMGMSGSSTSPKAATLRFAVDDVWRVLPAVYDSLAIPLSTVDAASRTIGNSGFSGRRRLGKTPMIRFFDCGSTQGGPSAETYDLHISVLSQVRPGESGAATLTTTIEVMGRPVAFSGEYVRCSSMGVLESRIADGVKAQLQR